MNKIVIAILFVLLGVFSCKEVNENVIDENTKLLKANAWDYPEVVFGDASLVNDFMDSPTEFKDNGTVNIGLHYNDNWEFTNESTIKFIRASINWQLITLNDSILHVNMVNSSNGLFLVECTYKSL